MTVAELIAELAKHPADATVIIGSDPLSVEGPELGHVLGGCYEHTPGVGGVHGNCGRVEGGHDHGDTYGVVLSPGRLDGRIAYPHTVHYWLERRRRTLPNMPLEPWIRMATDATNLETIRWTREVMDNTNPDFEHRLVRVDTLYTEENI